MNFADNTFTSLEIEGLVLVMLVSVNNVNNRGIIREAARKTKGTITKKCDRKKKRW